MPLPNSKETEACPPTYNEATTVPETTRLSEPDNNTEYRLQNRSTMDSERSNYPTGRYCQCVSIFFFLIGIALIFMSIIFKTRVKAILTEVPALGCTPECVSMCYKDIPFYDEMECGSVMKQRCDDQCRSVGIDQATIFSILFYVFIALGGLLIVIQVVSHCLRCCFSGYSEFKRQSLVESDIPSKV